MNDLTFGRPPGDDRVGVRHDAAPATSASARPIILLLGIAKRRKWLILGSVVLAAILGLVATLLMTPLYTATATLEIEREANRIVDVRGVEQESGPSDLEFYQTQYGLLEARSLAERVATDLRLYQNANFFQMFGADDVAAAIQEAPGSLGRDDREERVRLAADILLDHINIAPTRMSRLVDVQFTSPDPSFSAQVTNAWTRHFIELTLARRFEATSHARNFLEQRLQQLRQRLEESERTLVGYAAQERIVNIPSATTSSAAEGQTITERSLVAENLAALNQALNEAIADRTSAQARLSASGGSTTEALQNQAIATLRARRAELAADYERMLTQFDPQYPPAQAIQNQIRELDRSIAREENRVRNTIQATYQAALSRENALRSRVERLEDDLTNLRRRTIQYNIYQREVDTNRQLYDALLQRYKEIGVAGGVGVNNISIVDPAIVPENPSSPRLLLNLVMALLAGGALGIGLAIAFEQIDEGISDPKDIENVIGLPLLGTIPKSEADPEAELEDPKSALVESYLSAQTSLAFSTDHGVPRTLAVTSSKPSEGKTTTSYALSRSLARTGRKVILVDGDMRSPSLHNICGLSNTNGLSNFLAGNDDITNMVHRSPVDNLSLMTAGPTPPNAAELFVGDRLAQLSRKLLEIFDHVVIDAPPVMGLADAPLVGSQVEGVIFVLESHATRVSIAKVAINRLKDAQARVLGVLLTKFEARRSHYGYGYEYGYGYGENATQPS